MFFLFVCLHALAIGTVMAQDCPGVTVEPYSNGQSGAYNYFGVRATLATPNPNGIVTITGGIREEGSEGPYTLFTLEIPAGETTAQTPTTFFQACPTCNAEVRVTSVTPCPSSSTFNDQIIDYITSLVRLLNNSEMKQFINSLNLPRFDPNRGPEQVTDEIRTAVANRILASEPYKTELSNLNDKLVSLESQYRISNFTTSQWVELIRIAQQRDNFFFPRAKDSVRAWALRSEPGGLAQIRLDRENESSMSNSFASVNNLFMSQKSLSDYTKILTVYIPDKESLRVFGPCADLYEEKEAEMGTAILGLSTTCAGLGVSWAGAFCWGVVAAYYIYMDNYLSDPNGFWCDCMISHYGGCAY